MHLGKKIIFSLAFLITVIYLIWRGYATLPIHGPIYLFVLGVLLWGAEIFASLTGAILIWNKQKVQPLFTPKATRDEFPAIDVLIVTHNETTKLLHKTINAAVNMDYPQKEKVQIHLCDDGNRKEMQKLAQNFNIHYIGMEHNQHAKAGNINHALSLTTAPLVAIFDADMIPYPNFLLETVPFFIENQKKRQKDAKVLPLGLLQTPQSFYNADLFQYNLFTETSVANEQDFFSREINVLNNAHGAAIYTGSNTVIARAAIEAAGGFPTDTLTEDFELGAKINMAGFQNLSTLFPLASGLTPVDIKDMLKQRIRWGRGVLQSVRNIHLLTTKHLTLGQKLVYLNSYLYWWSFFRRMCFIVAPILYTLFGWQIVQANFWTVLCFWLPCQFFQHLALKEVTSKVSTQRWGEIQETILAPYLVLPILAQFFGLKERHFQVTDKNATRSKKDWRYGIPHLILWLLALAGIIRFNLDKSPLELLNGSVITFWLFNHLFNLSFALLFFIGRPSYREHERFLNSYPIYITAHHKRYQFHTVDLSDNGLAF
ncbi:glycosyltransferase [Enterococcus columbae]|uniref:Glycosyltransferase 2-like domain-containing protein n=1 Tax=Enterococcus columbae DSM 7374 = ATCC 51263 TaxID=1121865 RepID=S1N2T0_9ENTE|nr:glycosyltransferase [Enterococcus columbae]EOT39174.1 hypothetical protein OMW_02051 [Enterococcus columbae DSM 7374 = ATCC 51263]EOW79893.1 hypothetical protein I568_02244 [Enterococcus columbae DSM 7374 = ATCC 51263]OJG24514.1 hypothetical protein RR47_GL000237 [Enterococcus columbae DSM 7374 = ATCC 51263]